MENKLPQSGTRHLICIFVLTAALLDGCASQQVVTVRHDTTVTFPACTLVEVLPKLPTQPYIRIATLDARAPAGTPEAQLLAQLQAKAGALGANAIVIQNLSTQESSTLQYDPSGGQFKTTSITIAPHLRAIALRLK